MAKYRAIAKGYYNDVIHDPETDHHVIFEGPDGLTGSWFVPADAGAAIQPVAEVAPETVEAEAILDTESEAAAPVEATPGVDDLDDEDIPPDADSDDMETL